MAVHSSTISQRASSLMETQWQQGGGRGQEHRLQSDVFRRLDQDGAVQTVGSDGKTVLPAPGSMYVNIHEVHSGRRLQPAQQSPPLLQL